MASRLSIAFLVVHFVSLLVKAWIWPYGMFGLRNESIHSMIFVEWTHPWLSGSMVVMGMGGGVPFYFLNQTKAYAVCWCYDSLIPQTKHPIYLLILHQIHGKFMIKTIAWRVDSFKLFFFVDMSFFLFLLSANPQYAKALQSTSAIPTVELQEVNTTQ